MTDFRVADHGTKVNNVLPRDMRLADVVRLGDYPFADGVVRQITATSVLVFRPYAVTADFSYTGGVIPYIGTEEVDLSLSSDVAYPVLGRKDLK